MVDNSPFISQKSIQQALDAMLLGSKPQQPNPLENLILIENILSDPTLPNMENVRSFALHNYLLDLIRHEFLSQCHIFNLEDPKEYESRSQVIQTISQDAPLQVPELVGWGMLYYRYVRSDLNIRISDLSGVFSVDTRTLRRYQSICMKKLASLIAREEWSARREKHKRLLYSRLPFASDFRICGRDSLLDHARAVIENNLPSHLLITGPEGIGKTAFVQALIQGLIDSDSVDEVIWLTRPLSIGYAHSYLKQMLLLNEMGISLKEYTLLNRLTLVVDDISLLRRATEADFLWQELGNALVILTDRVYHQFSPHFIHLVLPEIDEQSVTSIVARARPHPQGNEKELHAFVAKLYDQVGGNPLAVKLAANNLSNINLQQPLFPEGNDLVHRLIASSYEAISPNAQFILFAFVLSPAKPIPLLVLLSLWSELKFSERDTITLLSCGLLDHYTDGNAFILPDAVRRFVQHLYAHSAAVRGHVTTLIAELMKTTFVTTWRSEVVEHILLQDWLKIEANQRRMLAESGMEDGISQGRYASWLIILGDNVLASQSARPKLCYAICLRQLLEFSRAEDLLREVIDSCGQAGDFRQQSRGMLELGTLLRQQGLYEQAQALIERARSGLAKWEGQELLRRASIELAQVLLDSGKIDVLKTMVADLSIDSADDAKAMLLLSETLIRLKDFRGARLYAERAMRHAVGSNLGRVYALLGRIATEERDYDSVQDWFDLAIPLLEQEQDWYGLARAKSNLAAALIQQRQFLDDAETLLLQAQATQRILNDRAGMIHTAHNIEVLNALKWIDEI